MDTILNFEFIGKIKQNPKFIKNGFFSGIDSGINFVIINPELYDMNIWIKNNEIKKSVFDCLNGNYRNSAEAIEADVFTNGPFMRPVGPKKIFSLKIILRFAYLCPLWPWRPYGAVIHNGKILEKGEDNSPWFGRVGTGSFHYYKIEDKIPEDAIEGIIGHPVIRNGKILNPTSDSWASRGGPICCWGLIPFDKDKKSGMVLVVGSSSNPGLIPQKMIDAGVIDAVGVDGGTSAIMGVKKETFFQCKWYKDKIQKYGLCMIKK